MLDWPASTQISAFGGMIGRPTGGEPATGRIWLMAAQSWSDFLFVLKSNCLLYTSYSSMKIEDGKIRVQFDHVDGGLVARPLGATYSVNAVNDAVAPLVRNSPKSELEGFAICGEDHKWVWACLLYTSRCV